MKISQSYFLELLEQLKNLLEKDSVRLKKIKNGIDFEHVTFKAFKEICKDQSVGYPEQTGLQTFPDIILPPFGIEVKFTKADKWTSTGNSIIESTRISNLKDIYIFFLKQGGIPKIKFGRYNECLSDIVVTHSPRYLINMELGDNSSIFKKMGIDYDSFRSKDTIKIAKKYYKSILMPDERLWWLTEESDGVSPIIKNFNTIDGKTKDLIRNKIFVFFPEIFSSEHSKYMRSALYLLEQHNLVNSSLRDLFSAGGKEYVQIGEKRAYLSRVEYLLFINSKNINSIISETALVDLSDYWEKKVKNQTEALNIWLNLIDSYYSEKVLLPSEIFIAGLSA